MWPFSTEVAGEAHAAFDHKTVYDQIHSGSGPTNLSTAVGGWHNDIGGQFDEIHGLITTGLKQASASWEGAAADAFHSDTAPMAQFVSDAKDVSTTVANAHEQQVSHFTDVRDKMPPPVQVTASDNWLSRGWAHVTGDKTDKEVQEQQAIDASDHAAGIYADYRNSTTSTTTSPASYPVVPTSNGVDAAPPKQTGGPLPYKGSGYQPGPGGGGYSPHVVSPPGPVSHAPVPPSGPPNGQQPPYSPPPTELQHAPVSGPPTVGPPGGFPPVGEPTPPPGGNPPIEPIGFYGPPGSGDAGGDSSAGGRSAGARGGTSTGFGSRGGAAGTGSNAAGRGASAGAGALEEGGPGARSAAGAAGRPGAAGSPGMSGAAGRGKGKGEEDQEHLNKFMEPTDEHWGTGEKTVPPVIGDPGYEP